MKTEEGISRQEKINERDVESEACIELGIRSSIRLNPAERREQEKSSEIEVQDNASSVEVADLTIQENLSEVLPLKEGSEKSNQIMPRCVQKLLIGILNINTLTAYKLEEVMKMYVIQNFDIIALVDTRITKREENAYNAIIEDAKEEVITINTSI